MKVLVFISLFTIFSLAVYSQSPASDSKTKEQKLKELMDKAEKKCVADGNWYDWRLIREGREKNCYNERIVAEIENKEVEYVIKYLVENSSATHQCTAQDGTNGASTVQFSSPPRR